MRARRRAWVPVVAVVALAALTARAGGRVEVTGGSMRPTLEPGDRLLVRRTRRVVGGQLVVVGDPRAPARAIVKRAVGVWAGGVDVRGDDQDASTDSRTFGTVPWALVRGRPWYRYAPAERAGRL